jgi:hypothetical protein
VTYIRTTFGAKSAHAGAGQRGQAQRCHRPDHLTRNAQRLPPRRHHAQLSARTEKRLGKLDTCVRQVLAAIEHQHGVNALESIRHNFD